MTVTALKHEPSGIQAWISVRNNANKPYNTNPQNGTQIFNSTRESRNIFHGFIASEVGKVRIDTSSSPEFVEQKVYITGRNLLSVCAIIAERRQPSSKPIMMDFAPLKR